MKLEGQRVRRTRWIHVGELAVQVEVDAVIPVDDPSEPCFEPETVDFLRQVYEKARAGDVQWLTQVGKVYKQMHATQT
jgi:hypothetical protein